MMPILGLYTCKEALARLDDYVDRELSPDEIKRVARHLKICHECARKFAFEESLLRQMRLKLQRIAAPPELIARITSALEADL